MKRTFKGGGLASFIVALVSVSGLGISEPVQAQTSQVSSPFVAVDERDLSEEEALRLLQLALIEQGYKGDTSERALREEYESSLIQYEAVNGCSTPKVTKALTKKWDRVFRGACNSHDVCYSKNSRTSRKSCDWNFREAMYRICSKRSDGNACRRAASTYYYAVRAFGKSHYQGKGNKS